MAYKIRLGGTNEFVSGIDPYASHCSPPGEVTFVEGWENPSAIVFLRKVRVPKLSLQSPLHAPI